MMVHYLSSLPSIATIASVLLLLLPPPATSASLEEPLTWIPRSSYDATPDESLGRHHPITFANETHGFVLGGSTFAVGAVPDLHVYDEASDVWIDASRALIGSPYPPRTYGYGVVLDESRHPKAYIGFGSSADDGGGAGRLGDWWEFDMPTLEFRELARFPGEGRHHPSVVPVYVDGGWHIHVGLGDGLVGDDHSEFANFDDYLSYSVDDDAWTRLPDFPGGRRHHPYYFGMGGTSYVGFGHGDASPYIYRGVAVGPRLLRDAGHGEGVFRGGLRQDDERPAFGCVGHRPVAAVPRWQSVSNIRTEHPSHICAVGGASHGRNGGGLERRADHREDDSRFGRAGK